MHLRDRLRTATSTASHGPGLRRYRSSTSGGPQANEPVRHNVLTAHHSR